MMDTKDRILIRDGTSSSSPTSVPDRPATANEPHDKLVTSLRERIDSNGNASPVCNEGDAHLHSSEGLVALLRIGPLAGLASLGLALLLLFASFGILFSSDRQTVDRWKPWEPTVWLAIFTAVSNKLIAFAAVQGFVVSWWRNAASGTTLGRLHTDWSYGLHAWRALLAGRNFNALALACLCATFVAIVGPLLQRASSVKLVTPNTPLSLEVSVSPELPAYWSGGVIFNQFLNSTYTWTSNAFQNVVDGFIASRTIPGAVTGCPGTCNATILAPALATHGCYYYSHYSNFSQPLPSKEALAYETAYSLDIPVGAPRERAVYVSNPFIANNLPTERETFALLTNISDTSVGKSCAGRVNSTICHLVSAIAEYPVTVTEDGAVTVADERALSYPKIVALANNTALTDEIISKQGLITKHGYTRTTLGGIADQATKKWYIVISLLPNNVTSGGWPVNVVGGQSVWLDEQHVTNSQAYKALRACAPTWNDLRDDVMAWINTLMFVTGASVAKTYSDTALRPMLDYSVTTRYNVTGHLLSQTNVFNSNMNYFAGAAALQIFSILAILYTFFGWWTLGWRSGSVSFSPLELAKAFDAPLLRDVPYHRNGAAIAKYDGNRKVQYHAISQSEDIESKKGVATVANKLTFVETNDIAPSSGSTFSIAALYKSLQAVVGKGA